MGTVVKSVVALVIVAGIGYFAFFVPLGRKTFYGHVVDISKTDEARVLEDELEKKVKSTAEDVSKGLKNGASELGGVKSKLVSKTSGIKGETAPISATPDDGEEKQPSEADRQALNRLLKKKNRHKTD